MGTRSQFYSVRLFSIVLWLTLFRLEDFLEDDEIRCIKEMSMQYANLGDYFFAPKKVFTSKKVMSQQVPLNKVQPCTIRFQKLCNNINVHDWLTEICDVLLIQPMRIRVGFSFLTKHPTKHNLQYMYAAPELAYANGVIETEVSHTSNY